LDTSFHGRERELEELQRLLEGARLVTLLGPPGAGKTRLARELVARRSGESRFCDLTATLRHEDVLATLEAAAGWAPDQRGSLEELDAALADRGLLVLDNAEHVVDALVELLPALSRAQLLVTSRTRLALPTEHVVELSYLPYEDEDAPALALFLERARRRNASFAEDEAEREAAHAIVRSLEGCPLALELAASRAGRASATLLQAQLERGGVEILTTRERHASRFDSLRAALDASRALLDDVEREALTTLSLLQGPWTLETAAAVLDVPAGIALDRVEALRDRSLVQMDPEDPGRYRVYEIVREHALADASEEAVEAAVARLSSHLIPARWGVLAFARASAPPREAANLHVVLERHLERGSGGPALQALLRLRLAYLWRGPHDIYATLLERVTAAVRPGAEAEGDDVLVALARAELCCWRGDFPGCSAHAESALDMLRARDATPAARALVLAMIGNLQGALYEPSRGMRFLQEAQATLPADAPAQLRAYVLQQLATFLLLHDVEEAERRIERALILVRPLGRTQDVPQLLALLAISRLARGARVAAQEAIDEARSLGESAALERWLAVLTLIDGAIAHEGDEPERALEAYARSRAVYVANGNPWLAGLADLLGGDLRLELGQHVEAERSYSQALQSLRPIGEHLTTCWALAGLGAVRARQDRRADAGRFFDQATELAKSVPLPQLRRAVAIRRLELDLLVPSRREEVSRALDDARAETEHMAVRFPVRLVARRLQALGGETLEVHREGRWFRRGGGERVDLSRRKRLAGVLACLATAPPEGVPLDALYEAGWPGERCLPGSDANRVHVTLSRLRGVGLDALIEHDDGRFRIVPQARLVVTP